MKEFGIHTSEKLKSKKDINHLFKYGKWINSGPLRIIWLPHESDIKFGVSVSKKYFKKAVFRNRVKRLLRETYRLNKQLLNNHFGEYYHVMFLWMSPQLPKNINKIKFYYEKIFRKE